MRPFLPTLAFLFLLAGSLPAAEPGLVLRIGEDDARVVRQVALFVPEGEAASALKEPGQVKAVWEGLLNLESRSRLVFTLEGSGEATLTLDDELLCKAIGKPSEEDRISSGEHPIRIEYTGPEKGDAQLRLFWEERDFGREPVPARAFTHAPEDSVRDLLARQDRLRRGHRLLEELRCGSCHGEGEDPDAPSLVGIAERLETTWLAHWIADPKAHRVSARMPRVFPGDEGLQKAADIARFLAPSDDSPPPVSDAEAVTRGGHLFHEQGCIGCHTLDAAGDADRIGLAEIGRKFRPAALAAFLREPAAHHAATRMPDFGFDEPESLALEAFLRSLAQAEPPAPVEGDAARGEGLLKQSGCLNCHGLGETESELPAARPLAELGGADCKAADYALSEADEAALTAALGAPKPRPVPAEFATHQFAALRCVACHSRDGEPAYREVFAEEVAHLAPPEEPVDGENPAAHKALIPHLDHLGFKLLPEWRAGLLAGEVSKTRPWLQARMPAFPSRAAELAAGFSHAVGLPASEPEFGDPNPAVIKIGEELSGVAGFACGACHGIGDEAALAVFEGEGPNFREAGARLRGEYFHLWMNDPLRQWPGTIMPKYATDGTTPLTQYFEGDATRQFEAILQYLRTLPTLPKP